LKSWSLSLLEPSGPVQACNGIALPLPLLVLAVVAHCGAVCRLHIRPSVHCGTTVTQAIASITATSYYISIKGSFYITAKLYE